MDVVELCRAHKVQFYFTGVQNNVMRQLRRHHFDAYVGEDVFYWDVIKVIEMLEGKLGNLLFFIRKEVSCTSR